MLSCVSHLPVNLKPHERFKSWLTILWSGLSASPNCLSSVTVSPRFNDAIRALNYCFHTADVAICCRDAGYGRVAAGVTNATSVQPVLSVERTVFYRERAAGVSAPLVPQTLALGTDLCPKVQENRFLLWPLDETDRATGIASRLDRRWPDFTQPSALHTACTRQ